MSSPPIVRLKGLVSIVALFNDVSTSIEVHPDDNLQFEVNET